MEKTYGSFTKKISALVLASGFSRRFDLDPNEDKLIKFFKHKPLFQWTLDRLEGMPFYEVIIVSRQAEILSYGASKGFDLIENPHAQEGISASIRLGISRASEVADAYMFFTADQPFLKEEDMISLMRAFESNDKAIVVPRVGNSSGSPTIFPREYRSDLLALRGDQGGRTIIKQEGQNVIYVDLPDEMSLKDIDTKEDFLYFESR